VSVYYDPDGNPMTTLEWRKAFETWDRTVRKTEVNGLLVSTVWLGMDHNFSQTGPPLIFETMVFGNDGEEYCERYATKTEAKKGHNDAVEWAKNQPGDVR
jgi:hypothetical protein